MTIYFLFGYTGSGKSFIGKQLSARGITHLEGDQFITEDMRSFLAEKKQMTREMIYVFTDILIEEIKKTHNQLSGESFVVTQAMYVNDCRERILQAVSDLQFVWVQSDTPLRKQRVLERFENNESGVSEEYANEMDPLFEAPKHPVIVLNNSSISEETLMEEIREVMPELYLETKTFRM